MWISTAYAQAAGSQGGEFNMMTILPLVLIFVVFYFLLIRPQQQKMKHHKTMLGALRRGDRVVTGGGIVGTIVKAQGDEDCVVEIADGVRVRVVRSTIQSVVSRAEPAGEKEKSSSDDAKKAESGKK